jgi:RimJ/RimL family protein N-acetyltransferase
MAMESMKTAFAGAFKTKRLVFKSIEDTDSHKDWLWKNLWNNPVNFGLANASVFLPPSQKNFKQAMELIASRSLLGTFICLPAPEKSEVAESEAIEKGQDKDKDKDKDKTDEDTIIGAIFLSKPGQDVFKRRTAVGIQIADEYQNKGYGREAINWAVDWAFTYGDMHRVDIGTASYNDRGAALYESIGFKKEGVTREALYMNRKWWDIIEFGMLVHEWEELRGLAEPKQDIPIRSK